MADTAPGTAPHPGRTRARRWPAVVVIVVVLLLVLWLAVCHAVLDNPRVERPAASDAVLVLGPPDATRMAYAEDLVYNRHLAKTLVISVPDTEPYQSPEAVAYYEKREFCQPHDGVEVICFKPDPSTTQGEAIELRTLAQERGWNTVTAVTFTQHVSRSRMILARCYPGELRMGAVDFQLEGTNLFMQYIHQSAGFVKAWLTPGCDQQLPGNPKSSS